VLAGVKRHACGDDLICGFAGGARWIIRRPGDLAANEKSLIVSARALLSRTKKYDGGGHFLANRKHITPRCGSKQHDLNFAARW